MAATDQPVTLFLKRIDIDQEQTEVRVRPSTELQKIISAYAYRWNFNEDALHVQTKQGKAVTGTMTVHDFGLEDKAVLLVRVAELSPFRPSHADHSDMAFDVDGYSFLVHKFPVLKSASPLLKDMVDEYDGDPVPLHVPGGAQVFDTVARFLYKDEVNTTSLFSFSNAASVRVAASYLQFDALAIAVDAFLEADVLPYREPCLAVLHAALAVPAAEAPENGVVQRCVRSVAKLAQWRRLAALASDVVAGVEAEESQGTNTSVHDTDDPTQAGDATTGGRTTHTSSTRGTKKKEPWQWALSHLPALHTLLSSEAAAEEASRRIKEAEPSSWPSGFKADTPLPQRISGQGGRCEALLMCLPPRLFLLAAATSRKEAVTDAKLASHEADTLAARLSTPANSDADADSAATAASDVSVSSLLRRADKARGKARAVSVASALFVLYRLAAATAADVAMLMAPRLPDSAAGSSALQVSVSTEAESRDTAVLKALQEVFQGGGPAWPDTEALPPTTLAELRRDLPASVPSGSGNTSVAEPGRQARWRALHDCADIIRLIDARALPPAVALRLLRLAQAAGAPQRQEDKEEDVAETRPSAAASSGSSSEQACKPTEATNRVAAAASSIRTICGLTLASSPGTVLSLPTSTLASLEPGVMCEALTRARAGAPARRLLLRAYWTARVGSDPERATESTSPHSVRASERAGASGQGALGHRGAVVHDEAPGLSLDELRMLLKSAKPHFGAPTGLSVASGALGLGEEAEDDLDGDAGSGFYRAALGVILDAVAREEAELDALKEDSPASEIHELAQAAMTSRTHIIKTLQLEGLLRLDLLPPRTLRAAMTHPGLPYQPIVDAALAQSEAVAAQLAATQAQLRRAGEAMRDSRAREGLCEHSHLPVMTAISVLRSSGQWTPARVQAFSAHSGLYSIEYRPAEGDSGPGEQRWYNLAQTRYRVEPDTSSADGENLTALTTASVPPPAARASPRLQLQPQAGRGSARGVVPLLPLGNQSSANRPVESDGTGRHSARSGSARASSHTTPRRDNAMESGQTRFAEGGVPATAIGGAADRPGSVTAAWPSDGQSQPRDSFTSGMVPHALHPLPDPGSARLSSRRSGDGLVGDDGLTASQRAGAMIRGTGDSRPAPARSSAHSRHRSSHSTDSIEPASSKISGGKRVWAAEHQLARLERAQRGQQRKHAAVSTTAGTGAGQVRSSAASRRQAEISAQINARAAAELATRDLRREAAFAADEAEQESDAMAASARAAEAGGPMSGRALREAARNAMQSATTAPSHPQRRAAGRR